MSMLPASATEMDHDNGPITAEGLLRRRAHQKPEAMALADPPNRQTLGLTPARSFTYAQADEAVDALAGFFIELGLEPGDRIVMQLPNVIEAPLALLGAWRAGLTVAAVPMLWRAMEIARVCDAIEPKALIGAAEFAGERSAEYLRDVAATRLSVRFVLGFGRNLPDGIASLDDAIAAGRLARDQVRARTHDGHSLITFTARAGAPFIPVFRTEDEILAQGAMAVLALALDRGDTILNPYPFTGPVGLGLGLAPWLIAGATLAQHHPFDYGAFVQQVLVTGATVTALPGAVLAELARDGVLQDPQCRLRRVGRVWSTPGLSESAALPVQASRPVFDLVQLGDLASLMLRDELDGRAGLPLGPVHLGEDAGGAVFVETKLGVGELLVRGPVVPRGASEGPLAADRDGFVSTGLRGRAEDGGVRLQRDPELVYHGGFTIAASELDGLYQAFPGFLDAACFVLPDPIVGDRIFAAVAPFPNAPVSLEALHRFLMERGVAPYKFPDKLLVVKDIPRDRQGRILRGEILRQV
ncbi:MAG: class I adenylate-forming enzyme family protein [Methyloceanibacter sp.]|uniref:class I adenylate-forming enzyme family protein n=1 Tax=Methyloceanibacter sp. TaxID=1965321 RepID=UPI003D6C75FE